MLTQFFFFRFSKDVGGNRNIMATHNANNNANMSDCADIGLCIMPCLFVAA